VATSTTRRLSNSAGAGNWSFYAVDERPMLVENCLEPISGRDVIEMMTASGTEERELPQARLRTELPWIGKRSFSH